MKCRSNRPSNLDSWGNIFFEEINNPPSKANCQNKSSFDSKVSPPGTLATEKCQLHRESDLGYCFNKIKNVRLPLLLAILQQMT